MSVRHLTTRLLRQCAACRALSTTGPVRAWFEPGGGKGAGHSSLLTDKNDLFEMVVDEVKPSRWDDYLASKKELMDVVLANKDDPSKVVANWMFVAGEANFKAVHLFRYPEGWSDVDTSMKVLRDDQKYLEVTKKQRELITKQTSEHMKSFSYWPMPEERSGNNIYDVRSYVLKPGNMYDWSVYWASGIKIRKSVRANIPYGGFFTQLGPLHTIYHIWCYTDLTDRKNCREGTWHNSEWNKVVSKTVPLFLKMKSSILQPLSFSPTQ